MEINMVYLALFSVRLILAAVLLTSSFPKLRATHSFAASVQAYHLLPQRWVRPFALTLPWLELALGTMLLVGWQTRFAALASASLLLVFLVAMGLNLARGRKNLDCGCSGKKHAQKIGWKTIIRNLALILFALPVVIWGGGFLAFDIQSPAIQKFLWETILLNGLLPLALSSAELWLLSRLLRQTMRLVMLASAENQPTENPKNFRNFKTNPMEGSS